MTRTDILSQAVATYGAPAQIDMAVEEAAELIHALCKFKRHASEDKIRDVLEEVADMRIMLDQMALVFGSCSHIEEQKIERLKRRLENAK